MSGLDTRGLEDDADAARDLAGSCGCGKKHEFKPEIWIAVQLRSGNGAIIGEQEIHKGDAESDVEFMERAKIVYGYMLHRHGLRENGLLA